MRCYACASASKVCMKSLRKHEDRRNENQMDVERTEVRVVRGTGCSWIEFCGDESLELVDAGTFWIASNRLLAGSGSVNSEQDPFRSVSWTAGSAHALAGTNHGALGTDDTRGAREVPGKYERSLRSVWIANGRVEGLTCE